MTITDGKSSFSELRPITESISIPAQTHIKRTLKIAHRLLDASIAHLTFVNGDMYWLNASDELNLQQLNEAPPLVSTLLSRAEQLLCVEPGENGDSVDQAQMTIAGHSFKSALGVPISLNGVTVAGLCVYHGESRQFTDEDEENLRLAADQINSLLTQENGSLSGITNALNNYNDFLENIPLGVFRTRWDGEIVKVNAATVSMMHADSKQDLLGRNILNRYVDTSLRQEILDEVRENGSISEKTLKARRLDGETFWIDLTLHLTEENGEKFFDGIVRDITEKKEAEEDLEEALRRLEMTTQAGEVGIWEWKVGTDEVFWDDELKTILGRTSESYKNFLNQIHPEDRDRVLGAIQDAVDGRSTYHEIFRINHYQSDEIRWIEAQGEVQEAEDEQKMMYGTAVDVTEREEAYRSLETSEKRLKTIINNTRDIFTVVDDNGRILYESPAIERVLGYDQDELLDQSAFDLIHPDDQEQVAERFQALLEDEPPSFDTTECRIQSADGEWVWLEISGSNLYQSVWNGYLLTSRNINDRRETEEALRESERRFRQMANNIGEIFWMHDAETHEILYVNPAIEEIWGKPPEYFYNHPDGWLKAIVEEDRERVKSIFQEEPLNEFDVEYRIERADGEIRWVHDHGYPVCNDQGEIIRLVGTARDITERKETEKELEQTIEDLRRTTVSRNHLDHLLSTMPSALMILNDHGEITRVNAALCELLNFSRSELLGRHYDDVLDARGSRAVENVLEPSGSGMIKSREVNYVSSDGRTIPVLLSTTKLSDDTNQAGEVICLGLDITERKEAQLALEENEKRFRQMAENIDEIIFMFSGDWSELHYISPRYESIYGRSRQDLEEDPGDFFEAVHPDDRDKVLDALQTVDNGDKVTLEYRVNESENYSRWVLAECKPLRDETGSVNRYVGTIRDITELKNTQQELQRALDEKANLLKEVHHRVKNNMQIISSILSLHERNNSRDPERMLDECENRIKSMAMIHDMMYQSENLAELSFAEYVDELVSSLIQVSPIPSSSVDRVLNVDSSLDLPLSQVVPCGLIIHELVSNSCEHAFAENRENKLIVDIEDLDDRMILRVQDNGPGLPEDLDPQEVNSVGFEILRALCQHELGGTLKYYSDPLTTVELELQLD
ncbi:MAG: PAS domain S-box protein [bacterium]